MVGVLFWFFGGFFIVDDVLLGVGLGVYAALVESAVLLVELGLMLPFPHEELPLVDEFV